MHLVDSSTIGIIKMPFENKSHPYKRKRVAVIGCTGSVGSSVMDVCRTYPEYFEVVVLAADTGREKLPSLCEEFMPKSVVLRKMRCDLPSEVEVRVGDDELVNVVERDDVDHVVFASSGVAAVYAIARALEIAKEISLANKESALILGDRLWPFVRSGQVRPLDSEHNALWQCMLGEKYEDVDKLLLTASGGPFLRTPLKELEHVTPEQAVEHPVWSMGSKISVDSATMINKGIELLEAHYLFGVPSEKIFPVIHLGSKVHGIVSFIDGTTKLLMSYPDMRLASLTAMSMPHRLPQKMKGISAISFDSLDLHFEKPSYERFPGLALAQECAKLGEPYPVILIASDAAAVELFLSRQIAFTDIHKIVAATVYGYCGKISNSLKERIDLYFRAYKHALSNGTEKKGWA